MKSPINPVLAALDAQKPSYVAVNQRVVGGSVKLAGKNSNLQVVALSVSRVDTTSMAMPPASILEEYTGGLHPCIKEALCCVSWGD
ncbi:hypothetical protein PHLCEN_2v7453 [Hermanssonia centrifuga]|uniref:Uncharacterized protein n=1 Tax=Hermanssonia centrifuga TaxID=98765 RepID=A0A2R6NWL3_9APHY|nr:hypothetical protein PHLCEN_2v7453 [Hermanssonia centrifuga]